MLDEYQGQVSHIPRPFNSRPGYRVTIRVVAGRSIQNGVSDNNKFETKADHSLDVRLGSVVQRNWRARHLARCAFFALQSAVFCNSLNEFDCSYLTRAMLLQSGTIAWSSAAEPRAPRAAPHPWRDARHARRAHGCDHRTIGLRRHAHDRKHYAHLAPNYVAGTIHAHFPTLGIGDDGKVVSLAPMRKRAPAGRVSAKDVR